MKKEKKDIILHMQARRSAQEASLDDIRDMLWAVIREKGDKFYLTEVFPAHLIYSDDTAGKHYKVAWSLLDGVVQLGQDVVEVESKWTETRSEQGEVNEDLTLLMRMGAAQNAEGTAWDVTICEPGPTKNGWYIPDEALRDAEALFEGVDVNLYELPQGATHVPDPLFDLKKLLVKNKVGWIDNVKHVAGMGLKGVLHFLDSAKWLGANLLSAMQSGGSVYGLSYDCPVRAKKDVVDGKEVMKIGKFLAADSVDIVTRPAAGGKFNRAVASAPAQKKEANAMKKSLWDLIAKARPDLLHGKVFDTISDQDIEALARMAITDDQGGKGKDEANTEIKILRCEMVLKDKLAASDLPSIAKERIMRSFMGTVFKDEDLDQAIAGEKDYLAKLAPPAGDGGAVPVGSLQGGLSSFERACMAVDRFFGLTKEDMAKFGNMRRLDGQPVFEDMRSAQDYADYDQVPVFKGIRDMYQFFTGDKEVNGRFNPNAIPKDIRSRMDITSATFSYLLGNTLGRRMVKDYLEADFGESRLISIRKTVKDFRTQEAVLVGGFPDLATVDPEAADYDEIAGVTDEESSYTILQKGNLLTITRKTIINDDISIVQRLVSRLGRSARRTHAKYVWAFWISNGNCSDGTAWFTAPHGNLGSTAMSFAEALVAYQALAKMTEKDSGERLGLLSDPSVKPTLMYPIDLMAMGDTIVNDDFYYTGAADLTTKTRNSLKGKIEGFMNPLLTDATDWGLLLPPSVIDIVEMGYLNGRQEPELFVADSPQSEQVFLADKIRYKIRHEYAGAAIDFRSGYKEVVAG